MYLYIASGEFNINIPDVLLIDGFLPSVCGYQHPDGLVESAVWFKVAIIDSISIDCDSQRLSWLPLSLDLPSENGAFEKFSEEVSRCSYMDECILSSIDTLFASVSEWTALYQNGQKTMDEFFEKIMQLLHIDILPSIQLTSRYVTGIESMLICQDHFIKRIDCELIRKSEERNLKKQAHKKLRSQFMSDLLKPSAKKSQPLPKQLIGQLMSDITKDLRLLNDMTCANEGSMTRASSDLNVALSKLKVMQNESRSFKRVFKGILASVPMDPIHNIYMEMCIELDRCNTTIKVLTDKKLMMLSVKEAARSALQDLKSGEETFGIDFDCVSSVRCTDVLGKAKASTFLSIAEQITSVLANPHNHLTKVHREFCQGLIHKCEASKREKALFDDVVKNSDTNNEYFCSNGHMDSLNDSFFNCTTDSKSSLRISSSGSTVSSAEENNEVVKLRRAIADGHSECLTTHSLPESAPTRSIWNVSPRSVSTYFSPPSERGKHAIKNLSNGLLPKSKKKDEPSFKSYLPDLISLREEDSLEDSPMIVFDMSKIVHATEAIKNELMEHVRRVCFELQNILNVSHSDVSVYRQIWVNYESHLYDEMMQPLTELYQLQYSNITEALCESLETVSAADLDLNEALLVHLLQGACINSPAHICDDLPTMEGARENVGTNSHIELPKRFINDKSLNEEPIKDSEEEDKQCTLRHSFTPDEHQPRRLRTVRKSLEVKAFQRPTFLIYERKLNPVADNVLTGNTGFVIDEPKTMKMKQQYVVMFNPALKCIDAAISARTPAAKLRHLTQSLRETSRLVAKFCTDLFGRSATESGGDDLMDALVILLCNIDPGKLVTLYCQVQLLADVMPDWAQRGHQCYTLTQFIGACQFIQDRLTCKRNRADVAASLSD